MKLRPWSLGWYVRKFSLDSSDKSQSEESCSSCLVACRCSACGVSCGVGGGVGAPLRSVPGEGGPRSSGREGAKILSIENVGLLTVVSRG